MFADSPSCGTEGTKVAFKTMHRYLILSVWALILLCPIQLLHAQDDQNFLDMSLEELMEVPVVVSGSRHEQKITDSSVPITIITSEDIHYSGLTSLSDVLQFAPGMDVIGISRLRSAVGVRGLHDYISDRTLTLINGRAADSPFFGGSEFYRLPVLMEDIDRIEIVRGPGGAAWGANAFTGVINIITKKPQDVKGWFVSSTVNEFGDTYSHLRWGEQMGKWAWRTSVGYEDFESSDDAGSGEFRTAKPAINSLIGYNSYEAQDYSRNMRIDTEAVYKHSEDTKLTVGTVYSHNQIGDYEFLGFYPGGRGWHETVRSHVRIDKNYDSGNSGYLQWFGNFANSKVPTLMKWFTAENDIEGQYNFKWSEKHSTSVGANVRFLNMKGSMMDVQNLNSINSPYDEEMIGLFAIETVKVTDRLTLEGQVRTDWYTGTEKDWSTRLSAIYGLDEEKDHTLRLSFARAFRSPYAVLQNTTSSRIYNSGLPGYLVHFNMPSNLSNEETWSVEAGYAGRWDNGVTFRADAYYQRFEDLIGYSITESLPVTYYTPANIDGADSWGMETEIAHETKARKLSLWYSYNDFDEDRTGQLIRSYKPARHKAGLTARLFLPDNWTFNTNYKFTNTTPIAGETMLFPIEMSHRLDLTFAKAFSENRGELMFGVADLLNKTYAPHSAIGGITAHEIPGRYFFLRLQYRF